MFIGYMIRHFSQAEFYPETQSDEPISVKNIWIKGESKPVVKKARAISGLNRSGKQILQWVSTRLDAGQIIISIPEDIPFVTNEIEHLLDKYGEDLYILKNASDTTAL